MLSKLTPHITPHQLTNFLVGKLSDQEQLVVEDHLEQCSECESLAATTQPQDHLTSSLSANVNANSSFTHVDPHLEDSGKQPSASTFFGSRGIGQSALRLPVPSIPEAKKSSLKANPFEGFHPPTELSNHPRYKIIRPLGRGGMGTVWLAQHLIMDRLVALKVIRSEHVFKADSLERFRREVQAAAKLHHQNVVTAFDAEQVGGLLFLVVEYIDGETLSERLLGGRLPVPEACSAVRDAALGIAHAHASGMVHRDVKPGNLIRTHDGTVKVLDFGLVVIPSESSSITGEGMIVGTPDYVAPEQAEDPRQATTSSDVYSLGCTLYHLLSGSPPFCGQSSLRKLDAHRHENPPAIADIPTDLQAIVSRMMAKRPSDRFQSAVEIALALDDFCVVVPSGVQRKAETSPVLKVTRRLALLSGLGAISLTSLAIGKWWRDSLSAATSNSLGLSSTPSATDEPIGIAYPLLRPSSLGDGSQNDFQVDGDVLRVDAISNVSQVWLNFKYFESMRFRLDTTVRFLELTPTSQLKFALLSDHDPEYDIQFQNFEDGDRIVVTTASFGEEKTVAGKDMDFGVVGEWTNLAAILDGNLLSIYLRDERVLECRCDNTVGRYPAIAVLGCRVELRAPRALELN